MTGTDLVWFHTLSERIQQQTCKNISTKKTVSRRSNGAVNVMRVCHHHCRRHHRRRRRRNYWRTLGKWKKFMKKLFYCVGCIRARLSANLNWWAHIVGTKIIFRYFFFFFFDFISVSRLVRSIRQCDIEWWRRIRPLNCYYTIIYNFFFIGCGARSLTLPSQIRKHIANEAEWILSEIWFKEFSPVFQIFFCCHTSRNSTQKIFYIFLFQRTCCTVAPNEFYCFSEKQKTRM